MTNIKTMKHNTVYRVTKGNTDGGIVAGDIVSYDSSYLVMWDGEDTGVYDSKDLSDPRISDFECELAEEYRIVNQGRMHIISKLTGNRMAEVAAMFGKKLNERFTIRHTQDNSKYDVFFHARGFTVHGIDGRYLGPGAYYLEGLLAGKYEIVEGENDKQ